LSFEYSGGSNSQPAVFLEPLFLILNTQYSMFDFQLLIFTDAGGKLLVGDQDFSYTLNRMK
jgi:hypothetical protein